MTFEIARVENSIGILGLDIGVQGLEIVKEFGEARVIVFNRWSPV